MATIKCFEELKIWQMSREFCKDIFEITNRDPFIKDFRLKDQIRSSSGSIMDNIAEGFERGGNKEFIQFLHVSKGSCGEARSQLYRALDYQYITSAEFDLLKEKTIQISQTVGAFINYLKQTDMKGSKFK